MVPLECPLIPRARRGEATDKGPGFVDIERAEMDVRCQSLGQRPRSTSRQSASERSLAYQDQAPEPILTAKAIREDAELLQHRHRRVLRLVEHHNPAGAIGVGLAKVVGQRRSAGLRSTRLDEAQAMAKEPV
jgi:hypothetical protein